jgi:hypothetical protein
MASLRHVSRIAEEEDNKIAKRWQQDTQVGSDFSQSPMWATTFVKGTVLFTITLPLFPQVASPAMNLSLTLILKPGNAGQPSSSAPSRRQLGLRRCRERNHVLHNQTQMPASIALNQNSTKQHGFVEESRNLRLNIPECRY